MTGHKPGPWRYGLESGGGSFKAWAVVGVCSCWNTPEAEANARLIAAAPDLLSALQAMASEFEGCYADGDATYEAAKAAIAKATAP